jgi:hypothetical protein
MRQLPVTVVQPIFSLLIDSLPRPESAIQVPLSSSNCHDGGVLLEQLLAV